MRELTIQELNHVSGGMDLSSTMAAIGNAAVLAGRATYAAVTSPIGRYIAKNAGGNMALYGVLGQLNGNGTTAEGYAGAALGGLVGGASKNAIISGVGGQVTAAAAEGYLNGRGTFAQIFAQHQRDLDVAAGF